MPSDLDAYVAAIRACRLCAHTTGRASLPHEPRPVLRISSTARLLVAGQAPGVRVHQSGVPFDDASGDRLREWLGVDRQTFYDDARIAIAPMGFCFPGHDKKGGDLPPRPECRATWRDGLFALLPQIDTMLVVGGYAHRYHFARLGETLPRNAGVADVVSQWRSFAHMHPRLFPLPHPSWRNSGWLKRNPWFETELLPDLRAAVAQALRASVSV